MLYSINIKTLPLVGITCTLFRNCSHWRKLSQCGFYFIKGYKIYVICKPRVNLNRLVWKTAIWIDQMVLLVHSTVMVEIRWTLQAILRISPRLPYFDRFTGIPGQLLDSPDFQNFLGKYLSWIFLFFFRKIVNRVVVNSVEYITQP